MQKLTNSYIYTEWIEKKYRFIFSRYLPVFSCRCSSSLGGYLVYGIIIAAVVAGAAILIKRRKK